MLTSNRRRFITSSAGISAGILHAASPKTTGIDTVLRSGIERSRIPAAVGMVSLNGKTIYSGAFGTRDSSGVAVKVDSIFAIASMTKAITTVAALQLVDEKKIALDEPVGTHLPKLNDLDVLKGWDASGKPILERCRAPITLRHLLTHTSGLCYDMWDGEMFRYTSTQKPVPDKPGPLMFEPGARWQYGQGCDWAGRLVEAISGLTLEQYFRSKIFESLGMSDTSFLLDPSKFERLVSYYQRQADGSLKQDARTLPAPPKFFNGGGGLYSTAADYIRFQQMILDQGRGPKKTRILQPATVAAMMTNQIGDNTAGKMKSYRSDRSSDVDIQPGFTEKWGLGFLINTSPYAGGRSAGSLAWAGLLNTFYWIDPKRSLSAVLLMQYLPFVDKDAVGLLNDFERAVYSAI